MKKKLALSVLVIGLVFASFGLRFSVSHFEDGSGRVSMSYCLPFALCAEG